MSPKVDLNEMARMSRQRQMDEEHEQFIQEMKEKSQKDIMSNRPQTNSDANRSPFNEVLPMTSGQKFD